MIGLLETFIGIVLIGLLIGMIQNKRRTSALTFIFSALMGIFLLLLLGVLV